MWFVPVETTNSTSLPNLHSNGSSNVPSNLVSQSPATIFPTSQRSGFVSSINSQQSSSISCGSVDQSIVDIPVGSSSISFQSCPIPLVLAMHRPCPESVHGMTKRSKIGVFKPKCFTVSISQEPSSVVAALLDPN